MNDIRRIESVLKGQPTIEGAGVRLRRVFGHAQAPKFDPFLLLDDFHSYNPEDYKAGFPWHPHRGIETVTYMLEGRVEHGDSMGNKGLIHSGEIQWMTAGSGIIHQEMPLGDEGRMWGLQLWVNLPAGHKMMKPRYRGLDAEDIPIQTSDDGTVVKIIAGNYKGIAGPVQDIVCEPEYLDVRVPPENVFSHAVQRGNTVIAYVLEGRGFFEPEPTDEIKPEYLVSYGDGANIHIKAGDEGLHFIMISGTPIGEPVAWYGPIVMNTQEELDLAFEEYRNGTFIKS